ncbi:MAG: RraA family protein [Thaumarchaeota archaeon]|nr:RraA family protein [Nitrososphaerota archaeon]
MDFKDETAFFEKIEKDLYVPVISDSLDSLGYRTFAMSHRIRPLREDFVFAGRARTFSWMDVFVPDPNPYTIEIEFMDKLRRGDVVVTNTDPTLRNAPWGELMSTAAKARGARGAVVDSCVRDVKKIFALNFPVFSTAISPLDSNGRGRAVAYDIPVQCGGVLVNSGDLVFGDYDGVVVVPKEIEKQTLDLAFEKVSKENTTRKELMQGKLLREVYDKYKTL